MKQIFPIFSSPPGDASGRASKLPDTAMVFAAGLGTRMRPLTDRIPKPLVSVRGHTLIDRNLDALAEAGVGTAVVNIHHLADQVEAHVARRERPRVVISDERDLLLDQGGGIKKALPFFHDAPFLICNTDAFWANDGAKNLLSLAQSWDSELMDASLLLAPTAGSVGVDWSGDFDLDASGRIVRNAEKSGGAYVYTGVGIIKPQLFEGVREEVFRLAPFLFEAAAKGRLYGVVSSGLWCHVGTIAGIAEAEAALAEREH